MQKLLSAPERIMLACDKVQPGLSGVAVYCWNDKQFVMWAINADNTLRDHDLEVTETDLDRLIAHLEGFCAAHREYNGMTVRNNFGGWRRPGDTF